MQPQNESGKLLGPETRTIRIEVRQIADSIAISKQVYMNASTEMESAYLFEMEVSYHGEPARDTNKDAPCILQPFKVNLNGFRQDQHWKSKKKSITVLGRVFSMIGRSLKSCINWKSSTNRPSSQEVGEERSGAD